MGTRADFYVGRGVDAEWLGSIAWDGYPEGIPEAIRETTSERRFRKLVEKFILDREDGTQVSQGWPWPWEDSLLTDFAYAFDGRAVWASCFGYEWFKANRKTMPPFYSGVSQKVAVFPNMKAIQSVTFGERSGVIILVAGDPKQEANQ